MIFEKLITKIRNHKVRKRRREEEKKEREERENALFKNFIEDTILSLSDYIKLNGEQVTIREKHFLLFNYAKNLTFTLKNQNLGDYFQTIATKNALLSLNPKATFEFFDRDSLINYYPSGGGGQIAL